MRVHWIADVTDTIFYFRDNRDLIAQNGTEGDEELTRREGNCQSLSTANPFCVCLRSLCNVIFADTSSFFVFVCRARNWVFKLLEIFGFCLSGLKFFCASSSLLHNRLRLLRSFGDCVTCSQLISREISSRQMRRSKTNNREMTKARNYFGRELQVITVLELQLLPFEHISASRLELTKTFLTRQKKKNSFLMDAKLCSERGIDDDKLWAAEIWNSPSGIDERSMNDLHELFVALSMQNYSNENCVVSCNFDGKSFIILRADIFLKIKIFPFSNQEFFILFCLLIFHLVQTLAAHLENSWGAQFEKQPSF